MVRLIENHKDRVTSTRISGEYLMEVYALSAGQKRGKHVVQEVRPVAFFSGEEIEAVLLFVDTNREILTEKQGFHFQDCFAPRKLYRYYIDYLKYNKKPEHIEPLPTLNCFHSLTRGGYRKKTPFSEYMEQRISPELLKDSESLFKDRKFVDSLLKRV